MKKALKGLAVVSMSTLLFNGVYQNAFSAPKKPLVLKLSTKFVDDEQTAKSLKIVAEKINQRSNNTLDVQVYTGGQLPIGKDSLEQVVNGANWIFVDGINFLGDYVPDFNAIVGPMLYRSFDEYYAVTGSELVGNMKKEAEKKGMKILSLDYLFGFRSMLTGKEIKTPEDMKGLKIRVPNSQLYMLSLQAMGANPTPLPFPEVYSAIQQGVIDGLEGSIMTIYGTKIYEVRKQVSLTNHFLGVSAVAMSPKVWEKLTPEQQQIVQEEFEAGAVYNNAETEKLEKEYETMLKDLGVKFNEIDGPAFDKVIGDVYTKFPKWTPGIYDKIMTEINKVRKN